MSHDDYESTFQAALERLQNSGQEFPVHLDATCAAVVIGQLQLALRHPGNAPPRPAATVARALAVGLIDKLCQYEPELRAGFEMGWSPAHDVPVPR